MKALEKVVSPVAVMLLVFYIWALLAGELYSQYYNPCDDSFDAMVNFRTFSESCVTLFQIFTTSNVHEVLYSLWSVSKNKIPGYWYVSLFFVTTFYFIAVLWITNLILAYVWECCNEISKDENEDDEEQNSIISQNEEKEKKQKKRRNSYNNKTKKNDSGLDHPEIFFTDHELHQLAIALEMSGRVGSC